MVLDKIEDLTPPPIKHKSVRGEELRKIKEVLLKMGVIEYLERQLSTKHKTFVNKNRAENTMNNSVVRRL